jgi:indolepyruvate ferredoxin oxidoreductase beta subunit
MDRTRNILLCGVGGQGILLASELISSGLLGAGFDVKQSEVHGMAQRGGSVVSHIRYGEKVYSPLIEPGSTDFCAAFELLESLRYLPFFNKETKVIVSTQKILPAPVSTGLETYPEDVLEQLKGRGVSVLAVDAFDIAKALGEARASNVVLTGALSVFLPVDKAVFLDVIEKRIPQKVREVNREAFLRGRDLGKKRAELPRPSADN